MKNILLWLFSLSTCYALAENRNNPPVSGTNMALTISVSNITGVSCPGACDGSVLVTFSGGTGGPYTIMCTPGPVTFAGIASSPFICTGLCGGNYTIRVFDGSSTQIGVASNIVINEPSPLVFLVDNSTDVSCNGLSNGTADVSVFGGTSPYTLQWNDPLNQTGVSIDSLAAGTYTCSITDANGCTSSDFLTINEPSALSLNVTKTDITCNYAPPYPPICDGIGFATVTGGTAGYQYLWLPYAYTINNPNTLCAGSHTVIVTDGNGCKDTSTIFINEPPEFSIALSADSSHCHFSDGAAHVVVNGGTSPHSIYWSNGVTAADNIGLPAGPFDVMVIDAIGCEVLGTTFINSIDGPSVAIIDSTMITCFGLNNGTATAMVTGGAIPYTSVGWIETSQAGLTATNLPEGIATIAVYDAAGCFGGDQVYIMEPSQVVLSSLDTIHASAPANCDGIATAYPSGGTPGYSYTWVDPGVGVIGTGQSIPNLCVGTYTLTITDANNCNFSSVFPIHVETIGLKEIQGIDASIFPNPTNNGSFSIRLNDASYKQLHFTMHNVAGMKVIDKQLTSQPTNEISTAGLTSGIYFYQLMNADGKKMSGKIVISN